MDNGQPTYALIEWLAGLAFTLSFGVVGHMHRRISAVEAEARRVDGDLRAKMEADSRDATKQKDELRKEFTDLLRSLHDRIDQSPTKQDLQDWVRALRPSRETT